MKIKIGDKTYTVSEKAWQERLGHFAEYKKENLPLRQASYEHLDKALLTLSGGSLVLTVTFIHDVVPVLYWKIEWVLILAWISFVLSLVALLFSHKYAPKAIDARIEAARRYYLEFDQKAFNEEGLYLKSIKRLNNWALGLFLAGTISTTIFASFNIYSYREQVMLDQNKMNKTDCRESGVPGSMTPVSAPSKPEPKPVPKVKNSDGKNTNPKK
ncbi:MAG TPA: hypothetical protein VK791_07810 [bacterium]|nr:hypothetical protein [bacterium]